MSLLVIIPAIVLAAAMLASACRKAARAPTSQHMRDVLRIPPPIWALVGVAEAAAACGLALGIAVPPLGTAAATGVACLMTGAVGAHLRVGLAGRHLVPPAVLAVTALATAAGFAGS
ncbi:DoxX family protein [Nocardioides sp. S-58]|uniref:DoxX family protein n=1 Tax=Nocardioides renjunii TaxID=3095075 RepID=A0ABU5KFD4_9ACTN|nr:DoxX family protein [Nocardioides sp. S-58]MDZ5663672.1 DoxX family protein [Nocardioides sp. S-58]